MKLSSRAKPRKSTVIYDGECSFCLAWVGRLSRWDTKNQLEMLALQAPEAQELTGRSRAELEHAMHFVAPTGDMYFGAAAVREALGRSKWKHLASVLASLPGAMFIAERVYRRVAGARYVLGCDGTSCKTKTR